MNWKMIDEIKKSEKRLVSPIWDGERAFHFLCLGHLDLAKALGFELEKVSDSLTIVKEGQLTTEEELDYLIQKNEFDVSCFEPELQCLKGMLEEQEEMGENDYWCGGGAFGPLTVASGILGAEYMLRLVAKNPEFVERFVAYITDWLIELAKWETQEGQEFFWIAEPVASLLAPKRFWRFSGQYLQKIFKAADVPGMLHVCGKTLAHTTYLEQTGAQVLSIDYCTDIGECIRMVSPETIIMGNVSPVNLREGTTSDVRKEVEEILRVCEGYPNFVLSTGCSIIGETPDENMQVLFDAVNGK